MSFVSIRSATLLGVQGAPVDIETHLGMGLPGVTIVGQPDEACRESRDRVRAALLSCDLPWPNKRITVNLANGANERKGGAGLDVAIAIGLLVVQEVLTAGSIAEFAFVGELGLDGSLRSVPGVVPLVATALPRECSEPTRQDWTPNEQRASKQRKPHVRQFGELPPLGRQVKQRVEPLQEHCATNHPIPVHQQMRTLQWNLQ